jgi:hypothetical protein
MIAACDAPRNLQIDNSIADAITSDHLPHNDAKRALRHRYSDPQFAKRALEPLKMSPLVDQAATPHLAYFIDAIAELVAAILDVNFGVWERQITAIDVSDAGHWAIRYQEQRSGIRTKALGLLIPDYLMLDT